MLNLTANVMQEKEDLEQLVNAVVEAIGPEQIFCKHGFLLILIANKCQKPLSEYKVLLHDACPLLQPCQYALYNTLELERLLVEGHLFYSFLCQKEHLIYDSGTSPFPLSLFLRIHGVHEKATQVFSNGMARAFLFVEGAVFYMAKGALPLAAFMLHQAAEQALRTIILAVTGIEVRTHIIIELKQHLKKCAPQLSTFLAGPVEEDRRLLDKLEKAYTGTRYTTCYTISAEDTWCLISHVRLLLNETQKAFEEMIAPFGLATEKDGNER